MKTCEQDAVLNAFTVKRQLSSKLAIMINWGNVVSITVSVRSHLVIFIVNQSICSLQLTFLLFMTDSLPMFITFTASGVQSDCHFFFLKLVFCQFFFSFSARKVVVVVFVFLYRYQFSAFSAQVIPFFSASSFSFHHNSPRFSFHPQTEDGGQWR